MEALNNDTCTNSYREATQTDDEPILYRADCMARIYRRANSIPIYLTSTLPHYRPAKSGLFYVLKKL